MIIYHNQSYFSEEIGQPLGISWSLGNMGFSESKCMIDSLNKGNFNAFQTTRKSLVDGYMPPKYLKNE